MFVVLWEFDVKQEYEQQFTVAYSASGSWAGLFGTSGGHVETRLLKNVAVPLRYITMDVWRSREEYDGFLAAHREEYRLLDEQSAAYTTRERHLSSFETDTI
jgi:heme-degrading monooxygenase HmoA